MAVIEIHRKDAESPAVLKADGKNTYTDIYTVFTDNPYDGPITVSNAPFMPTFRSFYPWSLHHWTVNEGPVFYVPTEFDFLSRLSTKTPTRKGKNSWEVTCAYEAIEPIGNPLARPVKWSMSFAAFTRIVDTDIYGELVENSAGMQYNPPVEIDDSRPIVKAVRNEPFFNMDIARSFKDAINSSTWKRQPRYTVKVKQIASGEPQEENGISYYAVTYEFELAEEGRDWLVNVVDAGFYERSDGDPPFSCILDAEGNPVQEPVKLDGNGKILEAGRDPVVRTWHLFKERDFNALAL